MLTSNQVQRGFQTRSGRPRLVAVSGSGSRTGGGKGGRRAKLFLVKGVGAMAEGSKLHAVAWMAGWRSFGTKQGRVESDLLLPAMAAMAAVGPVAWLGHSLLVRLKLL